MGIPVTRLRVLGDVILTTPAVEAVRRAYPDAEIEWVDDDLVAPILEGNPAKDRLHRYPRSRFRRISAARRVVEDFDSTFRVARRGYGLVIDFHGNPRAAWLTFLAGAPRRIGQARVRIRSATYTRRVGNSELPQRVSAHHHMALARAAGAAGTGEPKPRIHLREDERAAARERLGEFHGRPFIAIHPGASSQVKRWPSERFAELARWARESLDLPTLVLYDPASPGTSRSIAEDAGAAFIQDRGVRELAALTSQAAVGVPVLAILGPSSVQSRRPLTDRCRTVTPPTEGAPASDVPPDDVKRALDELLADRILHLPR